MKNKSKDMCPRCKYCLGMTPQGMYSCGKADDGSELNIGIDVVLNCANFEWKDGKVEGKVADFCPKCKSCKSTTRECDGKNERIIEVECEDPYDGVTRTLDADSDICCPMFEARPNPTHVCYEQEVKTVKPGEKVDIPDHGRYPWGSDEDKVLKYCANDVTIIVEQMAREKQKELEDKVEKYEKILIDILNETYEHPQLFNHDIHAYELIPGHIRILKNSFNTMCDKYDPVFEENAKLKEEIKRIDAQRDRMLSRSVKDDKRWNDLNNKFWLPLCSKLYGTTKVNKTYDDILSDISKLKERADGNYKASIRKDELIKHLRDEKKAKDDELEYWKERCHNAETDVTTLNSKVEVLDKRNTHQFVMIGEKDKEIEELKKKNRELQIRVNDLLFQEKLNKSAFGYDYEEENGKLRVENERLRNMVKSQRNCSHSYYYSALKAEDKIEHIQKEAKKWKNKYKESYDILQEFFGEHSNISSVGYDLSGDYLTLKLSYDVRSNCTKYKNLENARERMKKLD